MPFSCFSCTRHVRSLCPFGQRGCDKCLPEGMILRTCSQCKSTEYCSSECQRHDWNSHKEACRSNVALQQATLGADPSGYTAACIRSLRKWAQDRLPNFATMGVQALRLMQDPRRKDTHYLSVRVEITEKLERGKVKFAPIAREITAKPHTAMSFPSSPGGQPDYVLSSDSFSKYPDGFLRVLVFDETLRVSVLMGIMLPPDASMHLIPYQTNWQEDIQHL